MAATQGMGVEVGRTATLVKTITEEDIVKFAEVSTDTNPLHLDAAYAEKTRFKQRVAHGIISASFISGVLGTRLADPGVTVVYLSQSLRFRRPVFIGDTITATARVASVNPAQRRATVYTVCTNQAGEQVVVGQGEILLDPHPFPG